ncbi:MAG: hypothetical protein IJX17_02420 [Clostridia bacterium]|nr:hypothetical protein [Clostridia bacterium]
MIPLINQSDKYVLGIVDNLKNAVLYKDMLAFYDAYTSFYSLGIENLPNYCVINNRIYLNGMCLLIKDYSAEFDFETLDLTLDYLKVLYYSIAKFSPDGNFPDRSAIVYEFEDRKKSSGDGLDKTIVFAEKTRKMLDDAEIKFSKQNTINEKKINKLKGMKTNLVLTLLLGIIISALSVVLGVLEVYKLIVGIIVAIVVLAVSITLFIVGKEKRKKLRNDVENNKDAILKFQSNRDNAKVTYQKAIDKRDLLKLEIYNYIDMYDKINSMKMSFDSKLLNKAIEYNMLSYNLKYDIIDTFNEHNEDILNTIEKIQNLKNKSNVNSELSKIYNDIKKKDWLYYNNYLRFAFIDKLIKTTEKTHIWQVKVGEYYVNPFDINTKELAEEKVSFLQNEDSLFINMPLNRLVKTNIFKEHKDLEFTKDIKIIDIKRLKMNYARKFYNYAEISQMKNVSYIGNTDLKHNKTVKLELIEDKTLIPNLIDLNIKLIEAKLMGENAHHSMIKETITVINDYEDGFDDIYDRQENFIDEEKMNDMSDYIEIPFDALYEKNDVELVEEIDDLRYRYTVNGETVIGYKF